MLWIAQGGWAGETVPRTVSVSLEPLRSTDLATAPPFFARRLQAVRCAFSYVASIMIVSGLPPSADKPAKILSKTPIRLQRMKRL